MDDKTKRRLIYAVIIIAIVVIFLPIPFSKHRQPHVNTDDAIPQKPNVLSEQAISDNQRAAMTASTTVQHLQAANNSTNNRAQPPAADGFQPSTPVMPETQTASDDTQSLPQNTNTVTNQAETESGVPTAAPSGASQKATSVQTSISPVAAARQKETKSTAESPTNVASVEPSSVTEPVSQPSVKQTLSHRQSPRADLQAETPPDNTSFMDLTPEQAVKFADDNNLPTPSSVDESKTFTKKIPQSVKADTKPKRMPMKTLTPASTSATDSPVVEDFSSGANNIVVNQSELGQTPDFSIRQSHESSNNATLNLSEQIKQNAAIEEAKRLNSAWIVQLASFPSIEKSRQVVTRLRDNGYAAFTQKTELKGKTTYRVYVGPFTREQQAEAMLHTIDHKLRMSGYVHHFNAADVSGYESQ